jgi:Fe-S-cluster containining protein
MAKDRTVHLRLFGASADVPVPVPGGEGTIVAILPAARRLTAAIMEAAVRHERAGGRGVTCKAGCAACCRHLVPISTVEAMALGEALRRLPPKRREAVLRRFDTTLARMREAALLAPAGPEPVFSLMATPGANNAWLDVSGRYQALALACPFLENERCAVYDDRPFACREHMVTSDPAACATGDGARAVPRPMFMTPAVGEVSRELDGAEPPIFPLPLLREWLTSEGPHVGRDHDGAAALEALIGALEPSGEG